MSMTIVGQRTLRKVLERHARTQPDKTFLVFEDHQEQSHSYTYRQFDRMVNRTANGLLDLGVTKGDRVNLHLTNCPEFLFLWFAIAKIGAVMVPTNPLSPLDELTYPSNTPRARCPSPNPTCCRPSSRSASGVRPSGRSS